MTFTRHWGFRPKHFNKWGSQRSNMPTWARTTRTRTVVIMKPTPLILWSSGLAQVFRKSLNAKLSIPVVAAERFENNPFTLMFSRVPVSGAWENTIFGTSPKGTPILLTTQSNSACRIFHSKQKISSHLITFYSLAFGECHQATAECNSGYHLSRR